MPYKNYVVLDTETANSIEQPMPYDISWIVANRKGEIPEKRSFIVYEVFCKERELMNSAYYAEKIPLYEKAIASKEAEIRSIITIKNTLAKDMKAYNTSSVYAYNAMFDKRSCNNDIRYLSKSFCRWFFPYHTEIKCIWNIACQLLMARKSFIDFAEKSGFISEAGNILTNAEVCYRYISKDNNFKEQHTGLADVMIENAILQYCFRQHKKYDDTPKMNCWQLVQKKRKALAS